MGKVVSAAVAAALLAHFLAAASAAGVAGTWTLTLKGGTGDRLVQYTLVQDGESLTFARVDERGGGVRGAGSIVGNGIRCMLVRQTDCGPLTSSHRGVVDGGTMKGMAETPRGQREWKAVRQPAK